MIKYRLKFEFKKEKETGLNRDNYINDILSEIDIIISDVPIRKPDNNEIILLSGEKYIVISTHTSFEKIEGIVYYDFITLLENKKAKEDRLLQEKKKIEDEQEKIKGLKKQIQESDFFKKKSDYYKEMDYKKYFYNYNEPFKH